MGVYRHFSILFLDIRGFTLFFDQFYTSDPEQTARLLKDTWEILAEIIDKHSGRVDKIMGDGVMVIFGNSLDAFNAAWSMMFKIAKIDEHLNLPTPAEPTGWLGMPFQAGVGIEEGMVGVEEVYIQRKKHELVIGMPVISAARLAAQAKPMRILVGEEAFKKIREEWNEDIFAEGEFIAKHGKKIKYWEVDMTSQVYED
jgi:adenylate cyclase